MSSKHLPAGRADVENCEYCGDPWPCADYRREGYRLEDERERAIAESLPETQDFDGMVAWAQTHILESIGKNAYQHAVWTVCEQISKWRYDQDHG